MRKMARLAVFVSVLTSVGARAAENPRYLRCDVNTGSSFALALRGEDQLTVLQHNDAAVEPDPAIADGGGMVGYRLPTTITPGLSQFSGVTHLIQIYTGEYLSSDFLLPDALVQGKASQGVAKILHYLRSNGPKKPYYGTDDRVFCHEIAAVLPNQKELDRQLLLASANGYLDLVQSLISRGASPNSMGTLHESHSIEEIVNPLLLAIQSGKLEVARYLLGVPHVDLDATSYPSGESALTLSIRYKDPELVDLLLSLGTPEEIQARARHRVTFDYSVAAIASESLIEGKDREAVRILEAVLAHGGDADLNTSAALSNSDHFPLLKAGRSRFASYDLTRTLLARGASVEALKKAMGFNGALFEAIFGGNVDTARLYLDLGTSANETNQEGALKQDRPLHAAARACEFLEIYEHPEAGAKILAMMTLLVSRGADVNALGFYHRTPLAEAIGRDCPQPVLDFLKAAGGVEK